MVSPRETRAAGFELSFVRKKQIGTAVATPMTPPAAISVRSWALTAYLVYAVRKANRPSITGKIQWIRIENHEPMKLMVNASCVW